MRSCGGSTGWSTRPGTRVRPESPADRVAARERPVAARSTRRLRDRGHPADMGAGRSGRGAGWRPRRRRVARHGWSICAALKHVEDVGLEVVAPLGRHKRLEGVVGHRSGALFESDLTVHRSIPTTTVARTLIDVSGRLNDRRLGEAVDDALRRRILRLEDLRRTAGRLGAAPGRSMRRVHSILAARIPGYDPLDSSLEIRALRAFAAAGLPLPREQFPITLDGVPCHLDLAYPDARVSPSSSTVGSGTALDRRSTTTGGVTQPSSSSLDGSPSDLDDGRSDDRRRDRRRPR